MRQGRRCGVSGYGCRRELSDPPREAEAPGRHGGAGAREDRDNVAGRRGARDRIRGVRYDAPHPSVGHRTADDRAPLLRGRRDPDHQVHHERDHRLRLRRYREPGHEAGPAVHRRGQLRLGDPFGGDARPPPEQEVRTAPHTGRMGARSCRQSPRIQFVRTRVRHRHPGQGQAHRGRGGFRRLAQVRDERRRARCDHVLSADQTAEPAGDREHPLRPGIRHPPRLGGPVDGAQGA